MQKQRRKDVIRWIKKAVAPQLPKETYKAYHKYFTPQMEKDEQGNNVLRMGYLFDHKINHGRRLLHTYDKYGLPGIMGYLAMYGMKLTDK